MSATPHFCHHQPTSVAAALELLATHGASARLIAGGTELLPKLQAGALTAEHLVSINRVSELYLLEYAAQQMRIGAGMRLSAVAENELVRQHLPALAQACSLMATPQIRNMGTVAGNLVNGSPCADTAGPLLIYDAQVLLVSPAGERTSALRSFFRGPSEVDIARDELLTCVLVPLPPSRSGSAYARLSARSSVDVAAASVAGLVTLAADGTISAAAVALGAVAPTPLRCPDGEALLVGQRASDELLARAADACAAAARPIDDVRATAAYRQAVLPAMIRRVLRQCLDSADGSNRARRPS